VDEDKKCGWTVPPAANVKGTKQKRIARIREMGRRIFSMESRVFLTFLKFGFLILDRMGDNIGGKGALLASIPVG
jgi:hypothetical protein